MKRCCTRFLLTLSLLLLFALPSTEAASDVGIRQTKAGQTCAALFITPAEGKSFCFHADTNLLYRWSDSAWEPIGGGVPSHTLAAGPDQLPAAGIAGRLARVTDNIRGIWMDTGTRWTSITGQANILDFGADPTFVAESAPAVQAAIDAVSAQGITVYGGTVFSPQGKFKISTPLVVDGTTYKQVNFRGVGLASQWVWMGAANQAMLTYDGGTNSEVVSVREMEFVNGIATSADNLYGVVGLRIGRKLGGLTGDYGTCNVTVDKNEFQLMDTAIEIWSESDQVTINDNQIWIFTTAGVHSRSDPACTAGCGSAVLRVTNNHIQGGQLGSTGIILNSGGEHVSGNTIQNVTGGNGILAKAAAFSITNNYSETTTGASYWIRVDGSAGYIAGNVVGGYPGAHLIDITATSHDIQIGSNWHVESGGAISSTINIAAGATGIAVLGKQITSGGGDILGSTVIEIKGDRIVVPIVGTLSNDANILSGATTTMFTITAGSCYIVYISQAVESYSAVGIINVPFGSATAELFKVSSTNANLQLAVSGLNVQAYNGTGATRTVLWRVLRFN